MHPLVQEHRDELKALAARHGLENSYVHPMMRKQILGESQSL